MHSRECTAGFDSLSVLTPFTSIIVKGTDATVKVGGTANMSGVFLTTSVVPDDEKWVPERLGYVLSNHFQPTD